VVPGTCYGTYLELNGFNMYPGSQIQSSSPLLINLLIRESNTILVESPSLDTYLLSGIPRTRRTPYESWLCLRHSPVHSFRRMTLFHSWPTQTVLASPAV